MLYQFNTCLSVTVDYTTVPKIDFFGGMKLPTLVFVSCFFQSVPVLILIDLGLVSDIACVIIDVAVDLRYSCSKKLKLGCKVFKSDYASSITTPGSLRITRNITFILVWLRLEGCKLISEFNLLMRSFLEPQINPYMKALRRFINGG